MPDGKNMHCRIMSWRDMLFRGCLLQLQMEQYCTSAHQNEAVAVAVVWDQVQLPAAEANRKQGTPRQRMRAPSCLVLYGHVGLPARTT